MASYNKVLLMGNLTRDPELRHLPSNMAVVALGLACNRRYRTKDGEDREETTFVDCEAFGRTAEVINQYLRKGKPIFIEGRLKLDQWQDREGNNRSKLKVVVENFQFIDSRGGDGDGGGGGGGYQSRSGGGGYDGGRSGGGGGGQRSQSAQGPVHEPIEEEDIPF